MSDKNFAPSFGPSLGSVNSTTGNTTASMSDLLPRTITTEKTTPASSTPAKEGAKRRGPNSHRVHNMFAAIGEDRVPLDEVIKKHSVSVHVARQSKRFDPFSDRGQVVIKTLSDESGNKRAYIWRVPNPK